MLKRRLFVKWQEKSVLNYSIQSDEEEGEIFWRNRNYNNLKWKEKYSMSNENNEMIFWSILEEEKWKKKPTEETQFGIFW